VGVLHQELIPNQGGPYEPSWVTFFIGQSKCAHGTNDGYAATHSSNKVCASINSDATISIVFTSGETQQKTYSAPSSRNPLSVYSDSMYCVNGIGSVLGTLTPTFSTNATANGLAPSSWDVVNVGCAQD
jgi:hypothetical protein